MKKNRKIYDFEDIGFIIAMALVSLVIPFAIMALIAKILMK